MQERYIHSLRIVLAAAGIAMALNGASPLQEGSHGTNQHNVNADPATHLVPIPCPEHMPWDPPIKDNEGQTTDIQLASIKRVEPRPQRTQPECWKIVRDNETPSEVTNPV